MKKKILAMIVLFVVTALLIGTSGIACAATKKAEYRWRFSIPWTRPLLQKVFEEYATRIEKETDGRINIKVFPDGLLGNHEETFKGVQQGDIELAMLSPYVNIVPGGAINFAPWVVSSYAEFEMAYDPAGGILHKVMEKAYNEVDVQPLFTVSTGGYGLGNNVREIKTPADFKSMKLRVSGSKAAVMALGNMAKGTGMMMETIPWSEVYNALSRKVVDGCWTTFGVMYAERQHEVLKYYTDLCFMWASLQVCINKEVWDDLPGDLKEIVAKISRETMMQANQLQMDAEEHDIKALKDGGLTIYFPTAAEKNVFFEASNVDAIWDEEIKPWVEKAYSGQNMYQTIKDELTKIREATKGKK